MEDIKKTLVDLAQKAWDANIKEDAEFYRNFLIDEAVGVNNFGIIDKASLIKQMEHHSGIPFTKVIMEDPKVIVLNPESALLIYKATIHAVKDGKELVFSDYATTAFVKRDGKWKGAFQQHSRIQTIGAKA
ncbi:hypothetical protein METP3_02819 [Methanosarcinales archaeon]|nr:hypothetical protein METP3_02819 [Methanosarcinales archaeon]